MHGRSRWKRRKLSAASASSGKMLTATLFLREAFLLGVARISLLEDVIAFLRRAEHDPDAHFDPRPLEG